MIQDSVVALVPEDSAPDVLTAIHRAGFGHLSRMIRAGRGPVLAQLQRAGVPVSQAPTTVRECDAILLITAAARSPQAASLTLRHGARQVWIVSGLGEWIPADDVVLTNPNVHVLPPHPAQRVPGLQPVHPVRSDPSSPAPVEQAD